MAKAKDKASITIKYGALHNELILNLPAKKGSPAKTVRFDYNEMSLRERRRFNSEVLTDIKKGRYDLPLAMA